MTSEMSEQNNFSFCDLTADADVIERSFVAESTTDKYLKGLVQFMLWLFDNHPEILKPEVFYAMQAEDERIKPNVSNQDQEKNHEGTRRKN